MLAIRLHLCSTAQLLCLPDLSRLPHWSAAYQPRENAKCAQHTAVPHTVCPSVLRPPKGPRPSLALIAALRQPILLCIIMPLLVSWWLQPFCSPSRPSSLLLLWLPQLRSASRYSLASPRLTIPPCISNISSFAPAPLPFHSPTGPPHPHTAPTQRNAVLLHVKRPVAACSFVEARSAAAGTFAQPPAVGINSSQVLKQSCIRYTSFCFSKT